VNSLTKIKLWFEAQRERIVLGLFMVPAFVVVAIFQLIPAISTIWFSLTDIALAGPKAINWRFIGIGNYVSVVNDWAFWVSMRVTTIYCVASLVIRFILGIITALYVTSKVFKGKRIMEAIFLLPYIVPGVIKPTVWYSMLEPNYGTINRILIAMGLPRQSWTYGRLLESIIIVNCWAGYAFAMILLASALASIPKEYYETAEVYGASRWFKFKKITFPLIKYPIILCLIMIFKEDIDDFTYAYMFTGEAPYPDYRSELLALYTYHEAFAYFELGYGCAVGFIIAIIVFILTLAQMKIGGA